MKEWHWRQHQYLKWPTETFTYFPGNKVSIYFFSPFPVSAHIRLMKDGAAGLACSSGRDSWLIRAWSIDLEYHQIYYCGRTMRAHSCNYRPDQYWLEIYWRKKKASNANRQFFFIIIYLFFRKINEQLEHCQILINMSWKACCVCKTIHIHPVFNDF